MGIEEIWDQFHTPLARFVRGRVQDTQTADDLLQDIYIRIHTHAHAVREEQRLESWVYQIARNAITDHYRRQKPLVEVTEDAAVEPPPDPQDDLQERLARSVRRMLNDLPDEYREALILTEYEGLTQRQLAEKLGISLSGAKSRVQRGRKLLRETILNCCHLYFDRLGQVIDYEPRCGCCAPTRGRSFAS